MSVIAKDPADVRPARRQPARRAAQTTATSPVLAPKPAWGISRLGECGLIDLPKIHDPRGNLTFIEGEHHLPFEFRRVYYLYDVPGGSTRGGHALKTTQQFIIAVSGSFDVVLDAGNSRQRYQLNRSHYGLYIAPMVWRELENFSSGAVALVLVSTLYDENDYIRDYAEFTRSCR
jgi:dTDP-4-dehydrorhamnose 3,5-epimerase-like enzyme